MLLRYWKAVIPAKAGIQRCQDSWTPAFAGVTNAEGFMCYHAGRGRPKRTSVTAAIPLLFGLFQALPVATCSDNRPNAPSVRDEASVPEAFRLMEIQEVGLTNDRGETVVIETHVADDFEERAAGYQHVPAEVVDETAILFVFPGDLNGTFHMRNVEAPLDILFFDSAGGVVATFTMAPDPEKLWNPGQDYRYALEMAAGRAARLGLGLNSSLDLPLE